MIIKFKKNKGALLLELLIVISFLAIILSVSANATFLSLRSNKTSGDRDISSSLATEALEAVRAIVEEDFQNIYGKTKGSQHYYLTSTAPAGKWSLLPVGVPADEQITINNQVYTRYVTINNVSRDNSTRGIQSSYIEADDDPSTQKVTVTVSLSGGSPVVMSEYFFRWKNKICGQDQWNGGKTFPSDPAPIDSNCPIQTTYYDDDGNIDSTTIPGSIQLQ